MPSFSSMVKTNGDGACLRLVLAHAQVENEIPARPRRAPPKGAREYHRLRALPIWGIHIQTKSTFICGINGVGGGGGEDSRKRKRSQTRVQKRTLFFEKTKKFSSINFNTPACNASGRETFHPKLCEASSVAEQRTGKKLHLHSQLTLEITDC